MIDFDKNFQDTYKTPSEDLLSNGEQWFFLETEKDILKNRREELGMTQQQVADAAHIQTRQYQRLENGERNISGASMRIGLSVCAVLKLDPIALCQSSVGAKTKCLQECFLRGKLPIKLNLFREPCHNGIFFSIVPAEVNLLAIIGNTGDPLFSLPIKENAGNARCVVDIEATVPVVL